MRTKVFLLLLLTLSLIFIANLLINVNIEEVRSLYETTIIVYTSMDEDLAEEYKKIFEDETQIEVMLVRKSTEVLYEELIEKADNPQVDVIWGVALSAVINLSQQGILRPYNIDELVEDDIKKLEDKFGSSNINYVGFKALTPALCVNKTRLNQLNLKEPKNWQDLIEEDYQGEIVMPSPTTSGTGFLIVASVLLQAKVIEGQEIVDIDENEKFLNKLNENIAVYTSSGSDPCNRVKEGKYAIGIALGDGSLRQTQGDDSLKSYFLEDKVAWELDTVALINKNTINPAAQTFFNWAVREETIKLYEKDAYISDNKMNDRIFPWLASHRVSIIDNWEKDEAFMKKVEEKPCGSSFVQKIQCWYKANN